MKKIQELRTKTSEEGFTLIELMIVVVIIGILAAVAIPIFANQQREAIFASVKSDVKNLHTALNTYLVKDPTSTILGYNRSTTAATGPLAASDKLGLVPITNGNQLKIRSASGAFEDNGTWEDYVIIGWTDAYGSNAYRVTYDHRTGKTIEKREGI